LSSSCILCTQYYMCLWIVFVLYLVYPILHVSLDCLRPVSCVPNITCVSGLSSSCILGTQDTGRRQTKTTQYIKRYMSVTVKSFLCFSILFCVMLCRSLIVSLSFCLFGHCLSFDLRLLRIEYEYEVIYMPYYNSFHR
jgi:hypothetical protein